MADDAVELVDHRFRCPGCDEEVDVSAEVVGQLVRCPYCNTEFFADAARSGDVVVDDTPAPVEDAPPAGELNALRISQLTALRQATLRVRSWWVIGVFLAVITWPTCTGGAFARPCSRSSRWPRWRWPRMPAARPGGLATRRAGLGWRIPTSSPTSPPSATDPTVGGT
jgi:uncharacterized Zn-finger protein